MFFTVELVTLNELKNKFIVIAVSVQVMVYNIFRKSTIIAFIERELKRGVVYLNKISFVDNDHNEVINDVSRCKKWSFSATQVSLIRHLFWKLLYMKTPPSRV